MFMNIFSTLFGSAAPAPAPAQDQQKTSAEQNQTVPNSGNTPPANQDNQGDKSPLDKYQDLWKTDPNAAPKDSNIFNVDQGKLMEAAGKMDFTSVIPKEIVEKVKAGGEGSTEALLQAMNMASQLTFAQSTQTTAAVVESAVKQAREQFVAEIPGILKSHGISDRLKEQNPLLSNPAAAPIVEGLKRQLVTKFPNATAKELSDMANEYLNNFAETIKAPEKQAATSQAASKETDWVALLTN